ncbi:hypothetical protein HaLaN_21551 [Haematococcus lacustris]|uniref:Uncharacterized protein n=1 Tax=Haematococcus lacustris TaxID=44745 RepID=A0A699ZNT1_HAELA|nr:hypothetical protein HaLaN_21551 [Haematococcus lacustris]
MGYATALKLAENGAQVYMVTRNIKKGVEAANKMRAEVGGTGKELKLYHLECEMISLQ